MSKFKAWLKRHIPTRSSLEQNRLIKPLLPALRKSPNYWTFNKLSVASGVGVGIFGCFMPIPFQTTIALLVSIPARANLILSLGLLWLNNPLTMVPIYWSAYEVGALVLNQPIKTVDMHLSWSWMTHELAIIWKPFLLGCAITGIGLGIIAFLVAFFLWGKLEKHFDKKS